MPRSAGGQRNFYSHMHQALIDPPAVSTERAARPPKPPHREQTPFNRQPTLFTANQLHALRAVLLHSSGIRTPRR